MTTKEQKKKLLEQLEALKLFPNNKLVKQLRKQIQDKLARIASVEPRPVVTSDKANITRSNKLRKYHRYIRLIRDNFPNLPYNQIRKQLFERKKGKEVSIPDVIWQDPSP